MPGAVAPPSLPWLSGRSCESETVPCWKGCIRSIEQYYFPVPTQLDVSERCRPPSAVSEVQTGPWRRRRGPNASLAPGATIPQPTVASVHNRLSPWPLQRIEPGCWEFLRLRVGPQLPLVMRGRATPFPESLGLPLALILSLRGWQCWELSTIYGHSYASDSRCKGKRQPMIAF